jgi:putative transcription factor
MSARQVGPITQDWTPVVVHKRPVKGADARDPKVIAAAIRAGAEVQTVRKFDAGSNKKQSGAPSLNTRKLDEETEPAALERVSLEVKHRIQKARLDKKLTQAQLGQMINERPQVVQEYESGKAIPSQQVLTKMERALGVKLRGKK